MPPSNQDLGTQRFAGRHYRAVMIGVGGLVIAFTLLAGMRLALSNADIVCWNTSTTQTEIGSCVGGSWGDWTTQSQNGSIITEQRTYSGFRQAITAVISYNTCSGITAGAGTNVTSKFAACQIQETRNRSTGSTNTTNTVSGLVRTETTGAYDESRTQTTSGVTYQDYLNKIDAEIATSSIAAVPALVHSGETTHIIWSSDHVKTCTVSGANGDSWPKPTTETRQVLDADGNVQTETYQVMPPALKGDEVSSKITQQTAYTLTCTTAIGTKRVSQVIVSLIPTFQER